MLDLLLDFAESMHADGLLVAQEDFLQELVKQYVASLGPEEEEQFALLTRRSEYDLLIGLSEWLDEENYMAVPLTGDERTHDEITREYLAPGMVSHGW